MGFWILMNLLLLQAPTSPPLAKAHPRLRATVGDTIAGDLIVEERHFRKLNQVITSRLAAVAQQYSCSYEVTFADGSYYTTDTVDTVLEEENPGARAISDVAIVCRTLLSLGSAAIPDGTDPLENGRRIQEALGAVTEVTVRLRSGEFHYSVRGGERDWVFNVQADLLERHGTMLQRSYGARNWAVLFGAIGGFFLLFYLLASPWRTRYDDVRQRDNPKHDRTSLWRYATAVSDPAISGRTVAFIFGASAVSAIAGALLLRRVAVFLFPSMLFAVGEQRRTLDDITSLRNALLWGFAIAFVVGFLSSVVASIYVQRRRGGGSL